MLKREGRLKIKAGTWEIDCPEMELRSRAPGGVSYEGPGSIRIAETGVVSFKLYCTKLNDPHQESSTFGGIKPGAIIPDASYFDLSARDFDGRRWSAEQVHAEYSAASTAWQRLEP